MLAGPSAFYGGTHMAKYEFTNAAGNRLVEKCRNWMAEHPVGVMPHDVALKFLRDEGYRSEYAFREFVEWLVRNDDDLKNSYVLGQVAIGMARKIKEDSEFIGNVEAFHTAMNRRFGVDRGDIVGEEEA